VSVLIAGCGDLGTELGLRLSAAGHRVVGLRRRADLLPAPLVGLRGDLRGDPPPLPDDVGFVVHAATADRRTEEAYRATYLDGLTNVLDALDRAGASPARVLLVSSTAVYGVDDGSEVDETTPARPSTATGEVLLLAEQTLRERVPGAVVLRLGGIYGPGRTRLIDQVRDRTAVVPDPPVHTNRIHRDDAAAACQHLLTEVPDPAPVYLGVDHEPAERGEVLRFLAHQLGLPDPPTGPETRSRGGDRRCRNTALLSTGFRFTYPTFREGYRAVLAGKGVRHP
jgi:nucleoside-diphosphate-sugar epimerase